MSDLINADERWPVLRAPAQREYYSETKGRAEQIVLAANRKHGAMLTAAIRPAGIFGEGDVQAIPPMLKAYEKGQTRFQLGANTNLFDWTYVGNVAYAHILAAVALLNTYEMATVPLDYERVDGEAFFITNAAPVYFWDFARMVWKSAGDTTEPKDVWRIEKETGLLIATVVEWAFWAVGRTPNLTRKTVGMSSMTRYFNIDKARRRLGYAPLVGVEEGVERATAWFREQRGGGRCWGRRGDGAGTGPYTVRIVCRYPETSWIRLLLLWHCYESLANCSCCRTRRLLQDKETVAGQGDCCRTRRLLQDKETVAGQGDCRSMYCVTRCQSDELNGFGRQLRLGTTNAYRPWWEKA